ncbi:hypothetical protein GH714_014633 [Hevea brasiliensis]|uniref:Uncharacterized protein n=1 Tax=Hevea brasiliensis TaxID=3981 RepID=A0A6A6N1M6_HEVBR|nr:hypothetical protein GH714_014633 [Hevea brasiliensis]
MDGGGGRNITVTPRPCSRRRVLAEKRGRGLGGVDGLNNSVKKLQRREICSKRDRAFTMTDAQERFRNIRLQEEYDTHDPKGHCSMVLPFLRKRSKIIEIVAARDIVFALLQSGICAAFSRENNQRICFLNVTPDEVIRSLFYNKNNDSLITVSVYASDNFSSLKCRSTRIEYIRRGKPDAGFALFESESLKWPGFVEFDDVNGKVLTYSAQDSIYKVFDLKNYTMLYSISDKNVQEIKISPGIMLLIFSKASGHVPLKILSIEDGTVLKSFNHLLHRNKKVDFIEQFNEKLLVKQENENLQILDVRNFELAEVSRTEFMTPSAFIFLYENQLFLTFRNRTVAVWNFRGELVTSFEDHLLWHPDCNTNNIYITTDQDLIISYCKADPDDQLSEGNAGSINISNILTGKCLAKIKANNCFPNVCNRSGDFSRCSYNSKKRSHTSRIRSTAAEALEDITALFYDEERNEIYTGNGHGLVHVVGMECGIDADAPLDYATIQIFPAQNRYEVFVCGDDEVEKLATGLLEHLLPHLPGVNNLHSRGSNANFKLQVSRHKDTTWFTKSTLNRFLQIVASPDLMNSSKLVEGEMSQLEEARKFHLSLYAQERLDHFESGETDGCNSIETVPTLKPEVKIASSDTSKDELLRAMDLRLTALRRELAAALNQAAGATCSSKDIINIIEFCVNFGAADLKNCLCKCFELSHNGDTAVQANDDKHSFTCMSIRNNANKTNGETQISRSMQSQTPVKYGVSPAMVAQVERQSSTESEESSNSSDENQISAERSRTLTRSVQPRRSASPMRRIQIGRTGSHRAPALSIKNLGHYPARERISSYRDGAANSSEDEGSEQISKKPENNVRRMTVQDAINLFESKQKDQSADAQRRICTSNLSLCTNKSVLRRWSASTMEGSAPYQPELVSEDSALLSCDDVVDGENSNLSIKENLESDFTSGCQNLLETTKVDVELKKLETKTHDQVDMEVETNATQGQESNGTPTASAEWTQQKEVELNQMLKKMMESQPVRTRKPQTSRNKNIPSDHRGGFYDHYKEKRDEKLRGENAGKKAEKEARFRALQQTLDERKAEMVSRSVKDIGKKHPSPKPQKSLKNPSQPANLRNESPKASVTRKVSSKTSTLPATHKSWPTTPSIRVAGPSPSKTPARISPSGTTPTRRKHQTTSSLPRSSAKVERSQPCHRNVKESQIDTDRSLKGVKEKMQQKVTKTGKTRKTKVAAASADSAGMVQSKPSFYNKMTKKSSIVPLESKPFRHKGSGVAVGVGPIVNKTKHSSQLEDSSMTYGNMIETLSNKVTVDASSLLSQDQDQDIVLSDKANPAMGLETVVASHQNGDESENINKLATDDDSFKDTAESSAMIQSQEESVISPIAWEEIDEHQNMQNSYDDCTSQLASPVHVAPLGLSSPRVRHSLSQMLQEDNSEPDIVEWGNAENPPAMVYQKDAPKGLKRLLKFARKSKGDANLTGFSSPSVFSEGEDDAEESKAISKRSTDNLLKKAAIHSKNNGQQNTNFFAGHEKDIDPHELLSGTFMFFGFSHLLHTDFGFMNKQVIILGLAPLLPLLCFHVPV